MVLYMDETFIFSVREQANWLYIYLKEVAHVLWWDKYEIVCIKVIAGVIKSANDPSYERQEAR